MGKKQQSSQIKSELDTLFKSKKKITKTATPEAKPVKEAKTVKKVKSNDKAAKIFAAAKEADKKTANAQKVRRVTEDGYKIYTLEELGLNTNGGDTDLCPFDCDCCF
jgi:hypothetical protein